jgi:hypothetical protein
MNKINRLMLLSSIVGMNFNKPKDQSWLKDIDVFKEMELIKQKKSKLSSQKRKVIMELLK